MTIAQLSLDFSPVKESWKPIAGFEGLYEVSDWGRVRSLDMMVRAGAGFRLRKGRVLKLKLQNGGYPIVLLSKDSIVSTWTVHRLVATAFLPQVKNSATVNHLDFDKTNNHVENLAWCSQSENLAHSGRAGHMVRAKSTKLTPDDVRAIRKRVAAGMDTHAAIGAGYGVSRSAIQHISAGSRWRHIK